MSELLQQALGLLSTDPAATLRLAGEALGVEATPLAHRVRGQALRALSRHAEAVEAFSAAAALAYALGDTTQAALVQVGSIDSLGMLGRYDEAEALALALESALQAVGASEAAAKVVFNLGGLHYRRDRYAEALACFERAAERFASSANAAFLLPHVWTNTALALTFLDRTDEALALYEQARAAFLETEQLVEAATVEANIGFVHHVSGRSVAALAALNQARARFAEQGRLHDAARYAIDAGDVYRTLNLAPEARECYEQALAVFAELPLDYDEARARLGRAATQPLAPETSADLSRAEAIFEQQQVVPQRAHAQLLRARLALLQNQRDEARRMDRAAARAFAQAGLQGWAAEASLVLDTLGPSQPRRLQRVRRTAQQTGRGWLECRALLALGNHAAAAGKTRTALRYLRASVAALETVRGHLAQEDFHTAFLQDKLGVYEALVALLLEQGTPESVAEALEQVERSRSRLLLERVLAAVEESVPVLPQELQGRLSALRAQLSRAYHREIVLGDSEARRLTLASAGQLKGLEHSYRQLLREAELSQPASASALAPTVPVALLAQSLCPEQCLVEYYLHRGELGAFVLTAQGVRFVAHLCTTAALEANLRRLRFYLQTAATDAEHGGESLPQAGIQQVLGLLYDQLLRPLGPLTGITQLVIVPQGPLHRVPFHALHDGTGPALERWELTLAPSASLWHTLQQRPRLALDKSMLLLGVPEPGIAQVAQELAQLTALLPDAISVCGPEATLATFLQHAPGKRLLHLATHGLFRADNPLFSGLRFADGWLLARDLYGMRLDAELVTLSACRTGVSDVAPGDELFGLVRGFLAAGVKSLAVSLWPADDTATARLMGLFYEALLAGETPSAALRRAQTTLRAELPHPYYWAPFCVIGSR